MGYDFELTGQSSVIHPVHGNPAFTLSIDGRSVRAILTQGERDGEYFLELDGQRERVFAASRGDDHFIHLRGRTHQVRAINALERAQRDALPSGGAEVLSAPMPGVVVEVAVEAGAEVASGELLMTIESMKLQTAIVAPHAASVAEICLAAGERFEQGATLIRLEPLDEEQGESR